MNKYIETKKSNNITIIKLLFSEISIEDAQQFKNSLYKLASDIDNKFVINAHKCSFLPSVAIGILISFIRKVSEKKGKVVFCNLTEQVRSIFEVTRLEVILEVYETEELAINSFK